MSFVSIRRQRRRSKAIYIKKPAHGLAKHFPCFQLRKPWAGCLLLRTLRQQLLYQCGYESSFGKSGEALGSYSHDLAHV